MTDQEQQQQEEFDIRLVKLWIQARDEHLGIPWIAKELRVSPRYANNRAKYLKSKGVKMPSLQGRIGITPKRTEELNQLIEGGQSGI